MISFASAKINLGLLITERREDGYHNIETIFYPIKMYDVLELTASDTFGFTGSGLPIPDGGTNLCVAAYQMLARDFELDPVHIHLLKNIPIGAGLGGGSSDAAAVLKLLNERSHLQLSTAELQSYAGRLGADCPFFITGNPVFASGIGTTFESIDVSLKDYCIIVIKPDIHISTKEAYHNIIPRVPQVDLRRAINLPIQEWKYYISNDFELGIFERYPLIERIKVSLYERGALYASMSGSGSAVFGIFEEEVNVDDLCNLGKVYYPVEV